MKAGLVSMIGLISALERDSLIPLLDVERFGSKVFRDAGSGLLLVFNERGEIIPGEKVIGECYHQDGEKHDKSNFFKPADLLERFIEVAEGDPDSDAQEFREAVKAVLAENDVYVIAEPKQTTLTFA